MPSAIENLEAACKDRVGGRDCIAAIWPEDIVDAIDLITVPLNAAESEIITTLRAANFRHLDVANPVGVKVDDMRLILAKVKESGTVPAPEPTE